ncbi:hypothetical protein NTD84_15525 [Pseudomonas sp. 14P_8.1_Bac3]|uniref:hypothetical protein n=1 Tax=Pseudomonas sp. 14P_8.1_Bac3 TaxID=2971621 RepID=UPI0021C8ECD6|nr:hypothetical protein [Pseudomonas sp. 14P_8.1_Bac3]MCU1761119.1 hypothetical protein [Pseudomonas sp. 14P_8.1_Bac3]
MKALLNRALLIWQTGIGGSMFTYASLFNQELPSREVAFQVTDTLGRRKMAAASREKTLLERFLDMKMSARDLPSFLCETLGKAT